MDAGEMSAYLGRLERGGQAERSAAHRIKSSGLEGFEWVEHSTVDHIGFVFPDIDCKFRAAQAAMLVACELQNIVEIHCKRVPPMEFA